MASFQNKYGIPVLPVVDDEGNVPVALDDSTEDFSSEPFFEELLLEITALRLAVQELYNDGRDDHVDFREMAISVRAGINNEG